MSLKVSPIQIRLLHDACLFCPAPSSDITFSISRITSHLLLGFIPFLIFYPPFPPAFLPAYCTPILFLYMVTICGEHYISFSIAIHFSVFSDMYKSRYVVLYAPQSFSFVTQMGNHKPQPLYTPSTHIFIHKKWTQKRKHSIK